MTAYRERMKAGAYEPPKKPSAPKKPKKAPKK